MTKKQKEKLIARLREPTYPKEWKTYGDFSLLAKRLDTIAEAVALIAESTVPTGIGKA